jgi:FMN phosphatase YigB (HAD superfamily)
MALEITAVTFDFWNTIAEPPGTMTAARRRAVASACAACEVEVEAELLAAALEEAGRGYEESWQRGRHFHPRQGAEILVAELGLEGAAVEAVSEAFLRAGSEVELRLAPHVRECIEELSGRGLRLGIVCDVGFTGGELLREFLRGEGLLDRFSGWAFSDEVGHYKPAPQIFEAALAALGAAPGEALHVGDLRRTDVAGAAGIGMATARYRGLHDDRDSAPIEADFVLDSHRQLADLLGS